MPADSEPEPMTVLYIGNMGYCQNLSLVVEAARRLAEAGENRIKFQLVGSGIEKPLIEKAVKDAGLSNVEILGLVSKERAIEMIRNAHALMLHLKDDGTMDKTIPSKVFDYMAGGRPILYGLKGEASDILGSIHGNLYYDPADPAQLADRCLELLKNYRELASAAAENLSVVRQRFLREVMTGKLLNIFKNLS
ncbi:hypothetical protein MASR1M12_21220 [Erysipelotrichia bacterium]